MTDSDVPELRRQDDRRILQLETAVSTLGTRVALMEAAQNTTREALTGVQKALDRVGEKVDAIANGLAEAQGSPAGRALVDRANSNAQGIVDVKADIKALRTELDAIQDWRNQLSGAYRFLPAVAALAAAVATIFGALLLIRGAP